VNQKSRFFAESRLSMEEHFFKISGRPVLFLQFFINGFISKPSARNKADGKEQPAILAASHAIGSRQSLQEHRKSAQRKNQRSEMLENTQCLR